MHTHSYRHAHTHPSSQNEEAALLNKQLVPLLVAADYHMQPGAPLSTPSSAPAAAAVVASTSSTETRAKVNVGWRVASVRRNVNQEKIGWGSHTWIRMIGTFVLLPLALLLADETDDKKYVEEQQWSSYHRDWRYNHLGDVHFRYSRWQWLTTGRQDFICNVILSHIFTFKYSDAGGETPSGAQEIQWSHVYWRLYGKPHHWESPQYVCASAEPYPERNKNIGRRW